MFIRIKTRKNSSGKITKYAYLVTSKRRKSSKKPPRQKVIAYLGKIIPLNNHQRSSSIPNNEPLETSIKNMFTHILTFNGFKEATEGVFTKNQILVDLNKKQVKDQETNQNLCLQLHEGFISRLTLKQILPYKPPEATEKEVGLDFAKKLLSAGLKPSQGNFLSLYKQISKDFHKK